MKQIIKNPKLIREVDPLASSANELNQGSLRATDPAGGHGSTFNSGSPDFKSGNLNTTVAILLHFP